MPIIHLGNLTDRTKPNFYVSVKHSRIVAERDAAFERRAVGEHYGPFIEYCTYESHHGLCIADREMNGYDDSDWYMTVWNPETHAPEEIFFATTRGWSYPCYGSSPDATEETMNAYRQYQDAQERLWSMSVFAKRVTDMVKVRADAKVIARAANVPVGKVLKLRKVYGDDKIAPLAALFGSRIRSNFKISLRNRIVDWLNDPAPKYRAPLSEKQMQYV